MPTSARVWAPAVDGAPRRRAVAASGRMSGRDFRADGFGRASAAALRSTVVELAVGGGGATPTPGSFGPLFAVLTTVGAADEPSAATRPVSFGSFAIAPLPVGGSTGVDLGGTQVTSVPPLVAGVGSSLQAAIISMTETRIVASAVCRNPIRCSSLSRALR